MEAKEDAKVMAADAHDGGNQMLFLVLVPVKSEPQGPRLGKKLALRRTALPPSRKIPDVEGRFASMFRIPCHNKQNILPGEMKLIRCL